MSTVTAIRPTVSTPAIGKTAPAAQGPDKPKAASAPATASTLQRDSYDHSRRPVPQPIATPLPMTQANSAKLFLGDYDTYDEAIRLIDAAKTSIQFETFTFGDTQGRGVADALIRARQRGVNVQVIFDSKAMLLPDQHSLGRDMLKHGVDVQIYQERNLRSPLVAIDHAKIILIDGKTALVGGSNFDNKLNYDVNFEVQGPVLPAIAGLFNQSLKVSKPMGKPGPAPAAPPIAPIDGTPTAGRISIGLSQTSPKTDPQPALQTLGHALNAIQKATDEIDLLMLRMDDDDEMGALEAAHKRGVKVRVILNEDSFNQYAASRLKAAGVEVKWFKLPKGYDELHAKVAIFDRKTVLGGSTNWVQASNYDNHEMGVWVQGDSADEVQKVYDKLWVNQTNPVGEFGWTDKVKSWVVDHLDFAF